MTDTTAPPTGTTPDEGTGPGGPGPDGEDPAVAGDPASLADSAENVLFGGRLAYGTGWATHEGAQMTVSAWAIARRLPQQVARAARLAWDADRRALMTVLGCQVGQGVAGALGLLATNSVLTGLLSGPPDAARLRAVLPVLAGVAAAGIAGSMLSSGGIAATGRLEPAVERLANVTLLEHAIHVELAAIETATFHNLLQSAQFGAYAARRMVNHAAGLLTALIGLIAAAGVLGVLHPLLLPLLVLITVPKGWAAVRSNRRQYASTKAFLEHHRQQSVVADLLVDDRAAEEVRVHDAGRFLLDHYRQLAATGEAEQARLARAEARTTLAGDALAGVATVTTYGLLGGLLVAGAVPLAAAGTAVLAIRTGTGNLGNLVAEINAVYEQALYVADLDAACRAAESRAIPTGGTAAADPEVVAAHGLSFTYPGATKPALDGVDVELRRGHVIALVGENGSGKTTLSRLIAGLYEPTSGTLTWDGVDVQTLDRASVFTRVALISQDFTRWPFTARVNITIGRPDQAPDEQRLRMAAARTDADTVVAGLPRGWNTLLARYFAGGVNLSGGQWQRVALGRGIFRSGALVICDEPTASLDPRAEIEAFDKIRQLAAEGHTVVLITHRLASVRHADHIYVLHNGRIAEHGTHEELLVANTTYAELFALQANEYGASTTMP